MSLTGKEMVKLADALFKKYRPYTLRLPSGSSITMDNLDSMIKLCKERGIPFDPATYPSRRGEKAKDDATQQEEGTTGEGTAATTDTDVEEHRENVEGDDVSGSNKSTTKKTSTPRGSNAKVVRGKRQPAKGKGLNG